MPERLLVTGATGFLGREIVRLALDAGYAVRGFARRRGSDPRAEWIEGDIADADAVRRAVADVDAVIHAAGLAHVFLNADKRAAEFREVNVVGTENVARAVRDAGIPILVLVSSVSVHNAASSPYADTKREAEERAIAVLRDSPTALTILRMSTLYGAGDPGNIGRLAGQIARRRFFWIGRGTNRKSVIHVRDAARACLAACVIPSAREGSRGTPTASLARRDSSQARNDAASIGVYDVSAPPLTVRELTNAFARAAGVRIPGVFVPGSIARFGSALVAKLLPLPRLRAVAGSIAKWLADDAYDGTPFERDYGFRCEVSLDEGAADAISGVRPSTSAPRP